MLRKDIGTGEGGFRKWQFSLILCNENVLTYIGGWVVLKRPKRPLRNIKMVPSLDLIPSPLMKVKVMGSNPGYLLKSFLL